MAACGLEASRRDSIYSTGSTGSEDDTQGHYDVVKLMAQFAAQMMIVLDKMNADAFSYNKPYV